MRKAKCDNIALEVGPKDIEEIRKLNEKTFMQAFGLAPEYYPRFGFERALLYGIGSQWEGVPDEAFMILVLNEGPCSVRVALRDSEMSSMKPCGSKAA